MFTENQIIEVLYPVLPRDVINLIFNFVNDGKTYKAILETCKHFCSGHKCRRNSFCNQLWTLIMKYPNKKWSWEHICSNPNTTMEIIEKYTDKLCHWNLISMNPNLTIGFIEKHPGEPWNWNYISANPNITPQIIEKYPENHGIGTIFL